MAPFEIRKQLAILGIIHFAGPDHFSVIDIGIIVNPISMVAKIFWAIFAVSHQD